MNGRTLACWGEVELLQFSERVGRAHSYALLLPQTALFFDAALPIEEAQEIAGSRAIHLFLTHGHIDHIRCLDDYLLAEVPIFLSEGTQYYVEDMEYNLCDLLGLLPYSRRLQTLRFAHAYPDANLGEAKKKVEAEAYCLEDGDAMSLAPSGLWRLEVHLLPGHSLGDTLYLIYEGDRLRAAITGDILFADSIGRSDFPGSSPEAQKESLDKLRDWIRTWPDDAYLCPGHARTQTLGSVIECHPFL